MFEHWLRDQEEIQELERMNAILVGSFTNPEAAKTMIKADNPDYTSSDEEFEQSMDLVKKDKEKYLQDIKKKKRRRQINKGK